MICCKLSIPFIMATSLIKIVYLLHKIASVVNEESINQWLRSKFEIRKETAKLIKNIMTVRKKWRIKKAIRTENRKKDWSVYRKIKFNVTDCKWLLLDEKHSQFRILINPISSNLEVIKCCTNTIDELLKSQYF